MIKIKALSPKQIFLIDGLGAAFSALGLLCLAYFEAVFGMPQNILYKLFPLVMLFSLYSLTCYLLNPKQWRVYLALIAFFNFLYCCLTLFLLIKHFEKLSILGIAYFLMEKIIVLGVIFVEIRVIRDTGR